MFRGLYDHTIDAKGRTSLPVRFRSALQSFNGSGTPDVLIVTTGIDRCLVAYPENTWRDFENKLASLSQFDPNVVQLRRLYVAGATECVLDKHSRLMIPPMLREYAEIDRDIVWAGMVSTIEIWSKSLWQQQAMTSRENRQQIAQALSELGL